MKKIIVKLLAWWQTQFLRPAWDEADRLEKVSADAATLAAEKKPDEPKADEKKKDKKENAEKKDDEKKVTHTHYVADLDRRGSLAVAVVVLVLLASVAWFGGREIVRIGSEELQKEWQKAFPTTAPKKSQPVVKVLPAAPRPPLPYKGNLAETVGFFAARRIDAATAKMARLEGWSRMPDKSFAAGRWVAWAGGEVVTYDYVAQKWE